MGILTVSMFAVSAVAMNVFHFCWRNAEFYSESERREISLGLAYQRVQKNLGGSYAYFVATVKTGDVGWSDPFHSGGFFSALLGLNAIGHKTVYKDRDIFVFQNACGERVNIMVEN